MSKNHQTAWERWELASLDDGAPTKRPPLHSREELKKEEPPPPPPPPEIHIPTAEEIEQIHQQAHNDGYKEGYEAGRQIGHSAGYETGHREGKLLGEEAASQLLTVAAKLDTSLAALDEEIAAELLALSLEIAQKVLRQTLALRPETVVGVVRDALTQLPHQHANIYLHPDDAALVRNYAGEQLSHAGHRIHEDARLQRNDVSIEASGAHVDATLATRWRRVVEALGQDVPWDGSPPAASAPVAAPAPIAPAVEAPQAEPDGETTIEATATEPAPIAAEPESLPSGDEPPAEPDTQDVFSSISAATAPAAADGVDTPPEESAAP